MRKIVIFVIGLAKAQSGCSEACPDIGDDFSCGKILRNYTEEGSVSFILFIRIIRCVYII